MSKLTIHLPSDKKFGMISQALSVHLSIAEGSSRKSKVERKRCYEISRRSRVEVDAALDIAQKLNYLENNNLNPLEDSMVRTFKLLSGLITEKATN